MNNKEQLLKLVSTTMPFGKFKGVLIVDLPVNYLEWFARKGFPAGQLGDLLSICLTIKSNGLEEILLELKRIQHS